MWTSTLDLDPKRVLITRLLGRFWSDASFSSLAPLQVQNLPRQSLPERSWVRVRNRLAGICGSDLHMVQGDGDFRIAPAALPLHRRSYPGHEVVGEVLEVGEDVQRIRVGDRVALQYGSNCLSSGIQTPCRSCAQGYYNLCEHGKLPGPSPIGGGWSEEMLLPAQQLFRLPADISDEQAVLLEPAAVATHAVLRRPPQQNERVLIIGAGTIGLLTLQVTRALTPQAEISVLARHSFQIEQATRLGATHIIYPQDSYTGIQRATDAQLYKGMFGNQTLLGGYDVIFDTVGNQKTLHHALRWARAQATVVLVGVNLHLMHIDLTPIWYREVNLIGSIGSSVENWPLGTNERRSTFEVALELIQHDQIHPEHLITHRFPLNNYRTALLTATGKAESHAIKVVFDYSLLPPSVVPNVRASAFRKQRSTPLIDESTSTAENETAAEGTPSSAQSAEPATSVAPLSPLFSSSQTVAPPHEDDEFDEMEDTIPAPAIAKHNRPAPAPEQAQKRSSDQEDFTSLPAVPAMPEGGLINHGLINRAPTDFEEDIPQSKNTLPEQETDVHPVASIEQANEPAATDTTIPSILSETSVSQADNAQSAVETEILYPETTIETPTIKSEEHVDEPAEVEIASTTNIEEPSEAPIEILPTDETPETSPEAVLDSDATFQLPSVSPQEATEHSNVQIDEVAQPTLESGEQPVDVDQYNSESSEQHAVEVPSEVAETSEEFALQPGASSELADSTTPAVQDTPAPSDVADGKETGTHSATGGTEKTLLHTERPTIVKTQNRPRPRTRKKNNRASVEKR